MILAFFTVCTIAFYAFLYYVLNSFYFFAQLNSTILLLIIALIISIPSIILIYIKKDRKKYFLFSSIWTFLCSLTFFIFGIQILSYLKINSGLANYTIYLYKYLFMFSPLLSLFFVSLHKCFKQKKQLIFLIALKYILPIILIFVFMHFLEFYKLLWLFAITDFCTTLFSIYFSSHKN